MNTQARRLMAIFAQLPAERQQELVAQAQTLLEEHLEAAGITPRFYLCPVCFQAAEARLECHGHLMIPCNAVDVEDCKPLAQPGGELKTRAPRWFLEATAQFMGPLPRETS
jgi:hypothetical protein